MKFSKKFFIPLLLILLLFPLLKYFNGIDNTPTLLKKLNKKPINILKQLENNQIKIIIYDNFDTSNISFVIIKKNFFKNTIIDSGAQSYSTDYIKRSGFTIWNTLNPKNQSKEILFGHFDPKIVSSIFVYANEQILNCHLDEKNKFWFIEIDKQNKLIPISSYFHNSLVHEVKYEPSQTINFK